MRVLWRLELALARVRADRLATFVRRWRLAWLRNFMQRIGRTNG